MTVSSGVVIFRFARSPSQRNTASPDSSTTEASSVNSGPVFRFVGAAQQLGAEYLRRLDDAQAAAVDDLRSRAVRFAERIHRLDDRNRRAVFRGGRDRAPDQLLRPQRPHAVLHGDQLRIAFQGRQSVFSPSGTAPVPLRRPCAAPLRNAPTDCARSRCVRRAVRRRFPLREAPRRSC